MSTKYLAIVAVVVIVGAGAIFMLNRSASEPAPSSTSGSQTEVPTSTMPTLEENKTPEMLTGEVKEFTMKSWYSPEDKKPHFSLNEMVVNQGDTVRIKVTNTFGMHDFTLDEFGIKQETLQDQETVIEFVADKVGDFVYYCSKPGHRAAGQWGTLKVMAN